MLVVDTEVGVSIAVYPTVDTEAVSCKLALLALTYIVYAVLAPKDPSSQ
jgi:hypothetical protein